MISKKKPAGFLEGIDKIIFDMDGVIPSEETYWDVAALTVYEIINSCNYFGSQKIIPQECQKNVKKIREEVFCKDKFITLIKDRGINSNWDLGYIVLCGIIAEGGRCNKDVINEDIKAYSCDNNDMLLKFFKSINIEKINYYKAYEYIEQIDKIALEMYPVIAEKLSAITGFNKDFFARKSCFWETCKDIFQEWYLGDKIFERFYKRTIQPKGKEGIISIEEPIIPLDDIKTVIKTLYNSGITLGVGTGRPLIEINRPLEMWGLTEYFDKDSFITYDDILKAENELREKKDNLNLTKPHPFMFLKGIFGIQYDNQLLIEGKYDNKQIAKTLIVGDAGADIIAAKSIGCKFAAVLTGYAGKGAKRYFETRGADIIIDSIRDLVV